MTYRSLRHHAAICCIWCSLQAGIPAIAQIGDGRDGSPEISGIVNKYTSLVIDAKKCDDELYVEHASYFAKGDLILIIQMQGAIINSTNTPSYGYINDYANAGNYEFARIKSVEGNKITLEYALERNYDTDGKTQVVLVPQYVRPLIRNTLTCKAWDGSTGGVLAIDATDSILFESNISVSGKGFRGGEHHTAPCIFDIRYDYVADSPDPRYYALKGEGIAAYGIGSMTSGRGAPANAGGGGNIHTTGGGGGGNFGCGGDGGWGYPVDTSGGEKIVFGIGGYQLNISTDQNKVFAGGGGGAGHEHYGNATSGANGGGIVILTSKAIIGNGHSILARGANSASGGAYGDGVGGAGGGGSVLISCDTITSLLTVDVSGGSGGSTIAIGFGPGGGGGGGVCWLKTSYIPSGLSVLYAGGNGGLAGGSAYGAQSGCPGGILTNLQIPVNTSYPAVHAGFTMSPTYFSVNNTDYSSNSSISFTNESRGGTNTHWDFGDASTSSETSPVHDYISAGNYLVTLVESNALCSDTASKQIYSNFKMPNVFSPNGDGINDLFPGIDLEKLQTFSVYNRWGEIVFHSGELTRNWDGNINGLPAKPGVYYYVIKYKDMEGETITSKGSLTLLR